MKNKTWTLLALILVAALSRFVPHPWNWTAIGAAALLSGSRFDSVWAGLLVPVAALFVSDLILGLHSTMVFTYGALVVISLGAWFFRERLSGWKSIGGAAVGSSLVFFVITNFGVWLMGGFYAPTAAGLLACYVAGLPFLASQMMGDLFYSGIFFGAWEWLRRSQPAFVQ